MYFPPAQSQTSWGQTHISEGEEAEIQKRIYKVGCDCAPLELMELRLRAAHLK